MVCDVCGSDKDVQCEIITKGDKVDRVYHFCPLHWVEVYRRSLDDFLEQNEYKVNSYIKLVADKLIVDAQHELKVQQHIMENGELDVEALCPVEFRRIRAFDEDDITNEQT